MSVPKQIVKRQKLARKRHRKQEARLRRQRRPGSDSGEYLSFDAPAGVKMSEVLGEFVEPLADDVPDAEAYRRLVTLGVLAWNVALTPEPRRQEMIDDMLGKGLTAESREARATCEEIVDWLIVRKQRYFAAYTRPILKFTVEDRGDHYYLMVMSAVV